MSKKSNSKKVKDSIQKLNLPIALEIKIKFIEGNIDYIKSNNDNLLFRTYLLSHLLHKTLSIGYIDEFEFLNSKLKFEILDKKLSNEQTIDNNNFIANQLTDINIDSSSIKIDNLINEIEQKLNLEDECPQNLEEINEEDKQLLKKVIEEKLEKNNLNKLIEYKPINLEDLYNNIVSLIDFHIIKNDSKENKNNDSSLLNKNKKFYYRHKGILLCGNSGIGKTHMFNCLKSNYLIPENINYFDINIYKDLQASDKSKDFIKSIFLFSKLLSPTVIFIENIDKIFPNNLTNNEDNLNINNNSEINPLLSEFIIQMEKMPSNVILLSSCEMPNKLNTELTKLGFFDYSISLPLPNYIERKNLIEYIHKILIIIYNQMI